MKINIEKIGGLVLAGMLCISISITFNKKYNNIYSKLDMIIENTNDSKVDSLQMEIMDLGQKLDSMILKYDYNWEFTN